MGRDKPKKSRTKKAPTDWGPWEYDTDRRCYVTSRINSHGVKEYSRSGECDPVPSEDQPAVPNGGLEGLVDGMRISPSEPELGDDEFAAQRGRMVPSSSNTGTPSLDLSTTPPGPNNPGPMPYPVGQGYSYMTPPSSAEREERIYDPNVSRIGMAPLENTAPQAPVYQAYAAPYGRPMFGTALPQNSASAYYDSANNGASNTYDAGSVLGNPANQHYGGTTQPEDPIPNGLPPTGPANNWYSNQGGGRRDSNAGSNAGNVYHMTTRSSSQRHKKRPLRPDFKICPSKDFKPGYVFKVLWSESRGDGDGIDLENHSEVFTLITDTHYAGEVSYSSIRRFVICKSYEGHSLCLPIHTYRKRGSDKPGIKLEHHATIYTVAKSSKNSHGSKHPTRGMNGDRSPPNAPIRVEPMGPEHTLDEKSLLNYSKVHTVEHNLKVSFIGKVHKDSKKEFLSTYKQISQYNEPMAVTIEEGTIDEYDEEAEEEDADRIHPNNRKYGY